MEYFSAFIKDKSMPFAVTWTDLENITVSPVSQTEKYKYHIILLTCGILKKKIIVKLPTKQTHICRKQTYGYQRGGRKRDK